MVPLVEERSFQLFGAWGSLLKVILSNRRPLFFQTLNNPPQPSSDCFFDLVKYQNLQEVALILMHLAPLSRFKVAETEWSAGSHGTGQSQSAGSLGC
jgi:hypothetical protein